MLPIQGSGTTLQREVLICTLLSLNKIIIFNSFHMEVLKINL